MKQTIGICLFVILFLSCTRDEWNDDTRKQYLDKCTETLSEEICKCSLEKVEKNFKPSEIDKGFSEATKKCMGL